MRTITQDRQGTMVEFDVPMLNRMKAAYKLAIEQKQCEFTFEGNLYLTAYAKYLIEYLEIRLGV